MRSLFCCFFRWVTLPQGCFLFVLFIYFLLEEGHIRNKNTETDPSNLLLARKPLTMSFRPKLFCFRPRKTLKFLMETSPVNSCWFFFHRELSLHLSNACFVLCVGICAGAGTWLLLRATRCCYSTADVNHLAIISFVI